MSINLKSPVANMLAVALISFGSGCGGETVPGVELAEVTGKVEVDGQPLPNAVVRFQPIENSGTYSVAVTDSAGEYSLQFNRRAEGAIVGKHKIIITTGNEAAEDENGRPAPVAEILPAVYHQDSELVRDVTVGTNTIDFDLSSKVVRSVNTIRR